MAFRFEHETDEFTSDELLLAALEIVLPDASHETFGLIHSGT